MRIAEELGVEAEIVLYQKSPPDRAALEHIVSILEDPVTNLVRRDAQWTKLGLTDADAETPEQVIALILKHKMLMQRPVIVKGDTAIIGRPKDRVRALLA